MLQTHSVALPDILCLILARMKQRGETAEMNSLCEAIESDWSGAHRIEPGSVKEAVHAALGQLIKLRKVYYTGNKGYFLVAPDSTSPLRGKNSNTVACLTLSNSDMTLKFKVVLNEFGGQSVALQISTMQTKTFFLQTFSTYRVEISIQFRLWLTIT